MFIPENLIHALFILGLITWLIFLYFSYKSYKNLLSLDHYKESKEYNALLSIIIAVKDEEDHISSTLETLGHIKDLDYELIVVNDRSTDQTGKIIEDHAKNNSRIKFTHIESLPEGWLGKVNALQQGQLQASGEFILFMDGDVEVNESVLTRSLTLMESKRLDHLTIMPEVPCPTFFLGLLVSTSQLLFTLSARTWLSIEERPLKCVKGIGPYNMVRKSALDASEGLEWLKLDISDDVALSHLIAKSGGRSLYIRASKEGPRFPWYRDGIHMMKGLEKNIVGGFTNYNIPVFFMVSTMACLPFLIPLLALLYATPLSISLALVALLFNLVFALKVKKYMDHKISTLFFYPFGILLINLIMIRAAYICYSQGGIYWSGTFYPLSDLKKGIRVKLGL